MQKSQVEKRTPSFEYLLFIACSPCLWDEPLDTDKRKIKNKTKGKNLKNLFSSREVYGEICHCKDFIRDFLAFFRFICVFLFLPSLNPQKFQTVFYSCLIFLARGKNIFSEGKTNSGLEMGVVDFKCICFLIGLAYLKQRRLVVSSVLWKPDSIAPVTQVSSIFLYLPLF